MRVVVVGGTGTIGGAVCAALEPRHEVVVVARRGPVRADVGDPASLDALFARLGPVGAVVCCAASVPFAPLSARSDEEFRRGAEAKLFGQVDLLRRALPHLSAGGSVTLTSGAFPGPAAGSAPGRLVNAGLEAFVPAAAAEMPPGVRLNVVSPGWVRETLAGLGRDGAAGTPAAEVARAYVAAVEGDAHGRVLTPGAA
jgi:NAD(P)-dependent dehydrogenase (short-subunit alcohol dehydrogenase family)